MKFNVRFGSENQKDVHTCLSSLFCDLPLIARYGKSHKTISLIECAVSRTTSKLDRAFAPVAWWHRKRDTSYLPFSLFTFSLIVILIVIILHNDALF